MAVAASKMEAMQPLPLAPAGSVRVADGVAFSEDREGNGSVFLWGNAAWSWTGGDTAARRLAAVQLVNTKGAKQREVADAFGLHENSLVRWRASYASGGVEALVSERPGPKGPSKLTDTLRAEIRRLRASGLSFVNVAAQTGVSTATVQRVMIAAAAQAALEAAEASRSEVVPPAKPLERSAERVAARFGLINDAEPVVCEGASLPLAGALLILPALVATGLLEIAARVYGASRAAFYSLRSLLCPLVFACLVGEVRAKGSPGSTR